MKKASLIIDGNFFLFKTFHICQKIKSGKPLNFIDEPEIDKQVILWKIALDFSAEIKRFNSVINEIVYTVDQNSWRKSYAADVEYKGNRIQSTDVDWNMLFSVHDEFIESLKANGVIITRLNGAEGDDGIFAWASYLNSIDLNAIIVSGDNDLLQLVNLSGDTSTIYYNKFDKKLYAPIGFNKWLTTTSGDDIVDMFNMSTKDFLDIKSNLNAIIKKEKIKIEELNPTEFIFNKILKGDDGDNVTPLYVKVKETKGGPKRFKVTDKHCAEILSLYKREYLTVKDSHFFEDEHIEMICVLAKKVIKIEDKTTEELISKWKMNRDLMFLHKKCLPLFVYDSLINHIESSDSILGNNALQHLMQKDNILKQTTYDFDGFNPLTDGTAVRTFKPKQNEVSVVIEKDNTDVGFNDDFWSTLLK